MTSINLTNNWTLNVLAPVEESPLENHGGMEIAADDKARTLYIYEIMMVTYGGESVTKACERYIEGKNGAQIQMSPMRER